MVNKFTEFLQETFQSKSADLGSGRSYVYLIVVAVLLVLAVGEWVVRYYIVPVPSTTPYQVNLIYTENNKNVVIGDSQMYRAFIANDDFLNLGMGGTTIPMMEIIVEQYYKYQDPGKVIIEVAPQLLSEDYIQRGTQGYEGYFNQNYPIPFRVYIFEPGIGSWIRNIKSFNDFSRLKEDRIEGEAHKVLEGKWDELSRQDRLIRTGNRVERQQPVIWAARDVDVIETYGAVIEFLVERGANVCMFRTPVDETYLELTKDNPSFAMSSEIYQDISTENGVRYVDFRDLDYDFSLDTFINQDHITPQASAEIGPLVYSACFDE